MKKLISAMLGAVMIASLFGNVVFANTTPPGEGTADKPYLISAPEDLEWINGSTERLSAHYLVVNDIVAPRNLIIAGRGTGSPWDAPFVGVFDGGGHTITVNLDRSEQNNQALFDYIDESGIVRNLNITGQVMGWGDVGGVAVLLAGVPDGTRKS